MEYLNRLEDKKINAQNHLLILSIEEYVRIATKIISNNKLQRRRVISSSRVYVLLKDDLKMGCVIPSIVLAFFPKGTGELDSIKKENIIEKLSEAGEELIILDGLQRSFTMIDLMEEIKQNKELFDYVKTVPLRLEVYTGISKIGVLYRMLTLNTGQTPMSTRHQLEIIYSDYKNGVDDVVFVTEAENRYLASSKEYRFNDIIDGFLSYITGDYLPFVREDLISMVKNLENLTKDDKQKDIFKLFVLLYVAFREKVEKDASGWSFNAEEYIERKPFARNVNEIFSKVQMIAAFGAAISFLIEKSLINHIEDIKEIIDNINPEIVDAFDIMLKNLDDIQINAKKIGNEQRMYFYYFVRCLFNINSPGYLNYSNSVNEAFRLYSANVL